MDQASLWQIYQKSHGRRIKIAEQKKTHTRFFLFNGAIAPTPIPLRKITPKNVHHYDIFVQLER